MSVLVNGSAVAYGDLTNSMESNDFLYKLLEILSCTQDTVVSLVVNGKSYRAKPADCVAELAKAQQGGDKTDEWSISLNVGTETQTGSGCSQLRRAGKQSARSRGGLATPAYNEYRKILRDAQPKVTVRIKEYVDRLLAYGAGEVRQLLKAGALKFEDDALIPEQLIGVKASKALRSISAVRLLP
jgi:hypothetical protein